jgi:hypothetical protein
MAKANGFMLCCWGWFLPALWPAPIPPVPLGSPVFPPAPLASLSIPPLARCALRSPGLWCLLGSPACSPVPLALVSLGSYKWCSVQCTVALLCSLVWPTAVLPTPLSWHCGSRRPLGLYLQFSFSACMHVWCVEVATGITGTSHIKPRLYHNYIHIYIYSFASRNALSMRYYLWPIRS